LMCAGLHESMRRCMLCYMMRPCATTASVEKAKFNTNWQYRTYRLTGTILPISAGPEMLT